MLYSDNISRRIYPSDIIENNDSLVITYCGDINGASTNYSVGLIKTDTLGNVVWAKDYNIVGNAQELSSKVIATSFGYLLAGRSTSGSQNNFLLAVSSTGTLLWSKRYGTVGQVQTAPHSYVMNLTDIGAGFLLCGTVQLGSDRDIFLARVDIDGNIDCNASSNLTIVTTELPTSNFTPIVAELPFSVGNGTLQTSLSTSNMLDSCTVDFDLGPDTTICGNYVIHTNQPGATFQCQDGSTADTLVVESSGTYVVTISLNCCVATDSINVQIGASGFLDLGPDTTICSGSSFLLSAGPSGPYSWQDGSSNPEFLVTVPGTYWVEVGLPGCIVTDTITVGPMVITTLDLGPDTTLCAGEQLLFDFSGSGATITWMDVFQTDTFSVSQAGTYWVESGVGTCAATDTIVVTYEGISAELSPDTTICAGESILLDLSGTNAIITWQNTIVADTFLVTQPGIYTVEISDGACLQFDTITVDIIDPVVLDLGPDTTLCAGEVLSFDFSGSGANITWMDVVQSDLFIIDTEGIYWVQAAVTNCFSYDTIVVASIASAVDLGPDTTLCSGESVLLYLTGNFTSVTWQDSVQTNTYSISTAGTYWVEVELNGCSATDTINVAVLSTGTLELFPDTVFCDTVTITLDAGPFGIDAIWSNGSVGQFLAVSTTGRYWATIITDCGPISDTTNLTFSPATVRLPDVAICDGSTAQLVPIIAYDSMVWSTGESSSVITVSEGTYSYYAIDQFGCVHQDTVNVAVDVAADGATDIPNVFTPNDDGVNEKFIVEGADHDAFEMSIFNRWGTEIFQTQNPHVGWNGNVDGKMAPDGTYFYVVKYRDHCTVNDNRVVRYGHVILLR